MKTATFDNNMALAGQPPKALNTQQKLAVILGMVGLGILILNLFNLDFAQSGFGSASPWVPFSPV